MFGQMMVEPVVQLDPGVDLETAIATLTTTSVLSGAIPPNSVLAST
jgi:hypothetical protein